jgi:hypothetical protein
MASSLRPGALLSYEGILEPMLCRVKQNWPSLQRVELQWSPHEHEVYTYDIFFEGSGWIYLGLSKKRWWHKWLPKSLQSRISPYKKAP